MTYQAKAADKAQQMITACQQALTIPKTNRDLHDPTVPYVDTVTTAKGTAWEAVIDCNIPKCNVGVVVRKYEDNSMRTQFEAWHVISKAEAIKRMAEAMERNDNDMEGAPRPQQKPTNLNVLAREGYSGGDMGYDEWDALRRTMLTLEGEGFDDLEVHHGEHESSLFCGTHGRVVASWCQATGTCRLSSPNQIAEAIADDVRNYIRNGMRYSTA